MMNIKAKRDIAHETKILNHARESKNVPIVKWSLINYRENKNSQSGAGGFLPSFLWQSGTVFFVISIIVVQKASELPTRHLQCSGYESLK